MKSKFFKFLTLTLCVIFSALFVTACSSDYEVMLAIGDGSVENDGVICNYKLADKFTDGYELKGNFTFEKDADLDDEFILSITFGEVFATSYTETTLYTFKGADLKNADGGKLNFTVKFDNLANIFAETSEPKTFNVNFHRSGKKPTDILYWNTSSYEYVFDGKTVKITK